MLAVPSEVGLGTEVRHEPRRTEWWIIRFLVTVSTVVLILFLSKKKIIKGRVNASVPHFVDCTFKFLHKTMQKQVVKGPPAAEGRHPNVAAPPAHLDHPWCRRNMGVALLEAPARCKPAVSPPSSAPQSPSTMAGYQPGDKATRYLLGTARTTLPGLLRFRFLLTCTCTNLRSHKSTNRIYSSAQTPMAGGTPHIALMTVSHTEHLVLSAAPCTRGQH